MAKAYHQGEVDTKSFAETMHIGDLQNIRNEQTNLESIDYLSDSSLAMFRKKQKYLRLVHFHIGRTSTRVLG